MNGSFLVDTNILIALFAGDQEFIEKIHAADQIVIPSIVVGELCYGARKSARVKENLERIERFIAVNVILACDAITAFRFGEVKDNLRRKGKPIPENDIWIAALALQHDLTLVSRDEHFCEIDGLTIEVW